MDVSSKIGVLLFILWMRLTPHEYQAWPDEYCTSQSPSDPAVNSMCIASGGNHEDFFTLGQRIMMAHGDTLTRPGDSVASGNTYPPKDTLYVELWAMKRKDSDHFLNGWLYVRAWNGPPHTHAPPNGDFYNRVMYIQMEDENGNAVGEFESTEYCGSDPPYKKYDPDDAFPPCGQVAPSAEKVSNVMTFLVWNQVVNAQEREALKEVYKPTTYSIGPSLYFKFSHTSCNKPEKIRLRTYVRLTKRKNQDADYYYGTLRTNWLKINWTGAADILHVGEKAECSRKLVYVFPGEVQDVTELRWIERVEPTIPVNLTTSDQDIYRTKKYCKAVRFKPGMDVSAIPSFAGRCLKHDEYSVSRNNKHECTAGATADPSFMKYSEYLKKRRSCMEISHCPCQCKATLEVYQLGTGDPFCPNFTETPTQSGGPLPAKPLTIGYTTEGKAGISIMEHRKLHGIVMLVVTLSFVPISIILARYFKETWIQRAHLQVLHVWYLVHVALTFMTLCMYLVGSIAIMRSTKVMGRSFVTSSMYHKLLGTGTILLFAGTVLIGSVRHVKNSTFRKIMMITHALLGFIYYFLGILTAITSSWIPGSPSSDNTECIDSPKFMENSTWTFMPYLVGWVGVDLIFHIVFTVLQCVADKKSEYKRPMYFPLVPILKGGETHDTHGKPIRVLLFLIYCGINLGITFMLVVKIISTSKAGCGFGPTTCTHSDLHTPLGMDICGI